MGDARLIRRTAILGLAAVSAAALAFANVGVAAAEGQVLSADSPDAVPNSYIVALRDSASPRALSASSADSLVGKFGGQVKETWQHALNGFHATLTPLQARRIAADPRVDFVQADLKIQVEGVQPNPPSWGLDRIDQANLPLDNSYTYPNTASNVTAYVIDTGVRTTHTEFGGRATWGTNTSGDGNNSDCHGHGTHVAGTVGAARYGVAKEVKIVAVKVLKCDGQGTSAGVVAGINWVTQNARKPAVANMSLGGGADTATDTAVRNSVASGITYAVASGNDNSNACNYSPARVREAISTNASNRSDARASFSNWGTCTDLFAPGQDITSTWNTSDSATNTISGTSMASPHAAGVAALYVSANPSATPAQVETALVNAATNGKITNPGTGSANKLLFVQQGTPSNPRLNPIADQSTKKGTSVSLQVSATDGTPPYTFAFASLPAGLTGSSAGLVTGAPTTAGVSTVTVTVTDAAGKTATGTFKWTVTDDTPGGCDPVTNDTDVAIGDNSDVNSPVSLTCTGNASKTTTVAVNIVHTYIGDLIVDLVAPDGTVYNLHNRTGGSADNINKTYTVDASSETASGQWKLRVQDKALVDTGRIDTWTLDA